MAWRTDAAGERDGGATARSAEELSADERRLAAAARPASRGGRRTRGWSEDGPRERVVTLYLSERERAEVEAVAGRLNMRAGSWIAELAVQFAQGELRPIPASERDLIAELLRYRTDVMRAGTVINQVAAHAHSSGEWPDGVERLVALSERLLNRVDEAAERANDRARWSR